MTVPVAPAALAGFVGALSALLADAARDARARHRRHLVEEIVGEIGDEYDAPRELYRRVAPGVFAVSARAPVSQVNERFGWNLPQGEYETVGSLVLERLGRVPKFGDSARAVQGLRVSER
jgi:Mg2+/Co2+ transporter CorB